MAAEMTGGEVQGVATMYISRTHARLTHARTNDPPNP